MNHLKLFKLFENTQIDYKYNIKDILIHILDMGFDFKIEEGWITEKINYPEALNTYKIYNNTSTLEFPNSVKYYEVFLKKVIDNDNIDGISDTIKELLEAKDRFEDNNEVHFAWYICSKSMMSQDDSDYSDISMDKTIFKIKIILITNIKFGKYNRERLIKIIKEYCDDNNLEIRGNLNDDFVSLRIEDIGDIVDMYMPTRFEEKNAEIEKSNIIFQKVSNDLKKIIKDIPITIEKNGHRFIKIYLENEDN